MGRPKSKAPLSRVVQARLPVKEFNLTKLRAKLYWGGNMSDMIRHALKHIPLRIKRK